MSKRLLNSTNFKQSILRSVSRKCGEAGDAIKREQVDKIEQIYSKTKTKKFLIEITISIT